MKVLLLTVLLIATAILLLGVKVFFVKGGKFPSGHVHDIPSLRNGKRRDGVDATKRNNNKQISNQSSTHE